MRKLLLIAALFAAPLLASTALAGDASEQRAPAQQVVLTGHNVCLGCSLKKSDGAAAQCSIYGHRHGLRIESARVANGGQLPDLAGRTVHYLDNDQSAALAKGETAHGKKVEVSGRLFPSDNLVEVASVRELE